MEDCERKYKEAFNMAVLEHKSDNEAVRESIERIFPQLKESEDEKIRKALISAINNICAGDEGLVNFNGFSKEQVLAWLEKQGKHANFRNKIQIGDKVTRNDNGELVNLSQLERVAKKPEKQGEQNPADKVEQKGMNIVEEDMTPFQKKVFCIIDTAIEEEQGLKQVCDELLRLASNEIKQKPAWSEEDENMCLDLIQYFTDGYGLEHNLAYIVDWLKSLKDKVGCEVNCTTKQEWSEEDEEYLDDIIRTLRNFVVNGGSEAKRYTEEEINWLKSLKDRYTWKPSDAQMASITCAVRKMKESACYDSELVSLLNDLKKLKRE